MFRALILFLVLSQACTTLQELDPEKNYMKTMDIKVNGKQFKGVAVAPKAPSYFIEMGFYEDSEIVKLTTVHREHVYQKKATDEYDYRFTPIPGLEDTDPSGVELGAFDSDGQHTWGYLEIHTGEKLPAMLYCNGEISNPSGVSACQSKAGLLQRIEFLTEVDVYSSERCDEPESEDGKIWTWVMQRGKCMFVFSPSDSQEETLEDTHRITTIGYDDVLIRD